jgi:hypothetical protein
MNEKTRKKGLADRFHYGQYVKKRFKFRKIYRNLFGKRFGGSLQYQGSFVFQNLRKTVKTVFIAAF